jgi:hypothetical protein
MMRNEQQQGMQQIWSCLPSARRHQVMVLIGRMIQRQLGVPSPHQRQATHNVLDKTEGGYDHEKRGLDTEPTYTGRL